MYLLAKKDGNDAQYALYVHSDGTLYFIYYNSAVYEITLISGVTRELWHHLVLTVSGTTLNAWYDGTHIRNDYVLPVALVSYSGVPLYIGAQKEGIGTGYHFEGYISDVQVYSTSLTNVQCELLYQGQYPNSNNLEICLSRSSIDSHDENWADTFSENSNDATIHGAYTLEGDPLIYDEVVRIIWDGVVISISDPINLKLIVGENATGIIVTALYAHDYRLFDGIIELNNSLFSYDTPGQRGYTVSAVSGGSYNISVISQNDETYAIWVLDQAILHLEPLSTSSLVSTTYDSQYFSVDAYLTDVGLNLIAGWINLTIDGNNSAVYCNGIENSVFCFVPLVSGEYTLEGLFEGNANYSATQANISLTAMPRDIVFESIIPTEMTALVSTPFSFMSVSDGNFQGEYQGTTYAHNFPINVSFSIWRTISEDYEDPRVFLGTWNITTGEGTCSLILPWDLDGNDILTDTDFVCYYIICLDGHGTYENITIETPVDVIHPLSVNLQIPSLTFSDQSTLSVQIHPLFDTSFTNNLDLTIGISISDDNSTWVFIGEVTTTVSGWQSMNWTCMDSGTIFFKAETTTTDYYAACCGYADSVVEKETTVLTFEYVGNFTYSDQGVLVALLATDDGEPLSDQTVFLELLDGTWISIGTGLTNDSGHVSILWTPTLPADTYSIQIRVSLAGSQHYLTPSIAVGQLEVSKEFTVVSIDFTTAAQGFVRARVTDDDGTPIPDIQVHFYAGSSHEYQGAGITDNAGYTRLNVTLNNDETLEAVVNEDSFYYGSVEQVTVALPLDLMSIVSILSAICLVVTPIAVGRKVIRGRRVSSPPSPEDVSRALEEERDSIPERVREHSEKRLAELDGTGKDSGEPSETLSIDDD